MNEKDKPHKKLEDAVREAGWEGRAFDFASLDGDREPEEIDALKRIWDFEKLKRAAWEAGQEGREFDSSSLEDDWSSKKIRELELMKLAGKAASPDLFKPFELGNFVPGERIGSGAAGTVYKCSNKLLTGKVNALKVLKTGSFSSKRFLREADLLSNITSPHVVDIENVIEGSDGHYCLVMEFVDGQSLRDVIESGGCESESEALKWMRQCCLGMEKVIAGGIIHRDLKPSNMLIDDGARNLLVCDFGLATKLPTGTQPDGNLADEIPSSESDTGTGTGSGGDDSASMTRTKQILGTPLYISHEQAADPQRADERSDIYSFGATFYHLLTGQPPFISKTVSETIRMHKTEPLKAPAAVNPEISSSLSELIERCLAKNANHRFASFEVVREQLEKIEEGSASPWTMEIDESLAPFIVRYRNWRDAYLQFSFPPEAENYVLPSGRRLVIQREDIVDSETDVIVSSDGPYLSMGGGVSRAIRNAAGKVIEKEAGIHPPIQPGRVVVTSAGDLPQRFIFHAVTMMVDFEEGSISKIHPDLWPSRDIILQLLDGCFYHAETYNVESIAFPLLGTGRAGFDDSTCLDTMVEYLVSKLGRARSTPVKVARILLWHRPDRPRGWNAPKALR